MPGQVMKRRGSYEYLTLELSGAVTGRRPDTVSDLSELLCLLVVIILNLRKYMRLLKIQLPQGKLQTHLKLPVRSMALP